MLHISLRVCSSGRHACWSDLHSTHLEWSSLSGRSRAPPSTFFFLRTSLLMFKQMLLFCFPKIKVKIFLPTGQGVKNLEALWGRKVHGVLSPPEQCLSYPGIEFAGFEPAISVCMARRGTNHATAAA